MSNEKKEPKVLIEIDNVRVVEYDSQNVKVERFEEVTNPITKLTGSKWCFIGYSRNTRTALEMIVDKELLIDQNAVEDLKTHLTEVWRQNQKVLTTLSYYLDGEGEQ